MNYEIYYDRPSRVWWAYWKDAQGNQITDAVHAHNRDECLIELGQTTHLASYPAPHPRAERQ